MSIPKNITKEHIINAISKIDKEGIPQDGDSQYYDVLYNERKYPPKLVVSYANIFANGEELNRNSFEGGQNTPCFRLLEENGFKIQRKSIKYFVLGASWYGNEDSPDQTERFIENGIWENGYGEKFLDVVKSVNVGDRVAIKSSYATRDGKSILRIKATGTVVENVGDGRNLKINWDKKFPPFDLEGYGAYRNTIQRVSDEDIEAIFNLKENMSYYPELIRFLKQAKTTDQSYKSYNRNYNGLKVKAKFGQGTLAEVPWIAFLNEIDTVQSGIYPVYLYYKKHDILILAYGVSETYQSNREWDIIDKKSITQFFSENNLGKPKNYGSSFIFKAYDTTKPLIEKEIDDDLNKIISIYKNTQWSSAQKSKEFQSQLFQEATSKSGIFVTAKTSIRFISSLLTKPFVILTGLSGSGKTKLAQAFAKWICDDETQFCLVPVGADWTNREPLLGFPNALKPNDYVKPENRVLDLIIDANNNHNKPYFLILDEMNLSHVERYFADFLSVMESKGKISLHSGNSEWNNVPPEISFPKNLFIIGTVNIDETTYMFSPKVLDRANVIEFRLTKEDMKKYLESNSIVNLENLETEGSEMALSFVAIAKDKNLKAENAEQLNTTLLKFFSELKKTGAEFGYRSASEILRFIAVVKKLEVNLRTDEIIDAAIMQKLLPKVHGSRRKLEPVLKTLGSLCLNDANDIEALIVKSEITEEDYLKIKYEVSFEKIQRMYQNLLSNGFTSYAEA